MKKHFKFFKKMPPEIMPEITKFQSLRERLTIDFLISKYFNENTKNPMSWNYTGAIDYNDFVQRMQTLPPDFQHLILSETKPYTLILSEDIIRILALPVEARVQELFTPMQAAAMHSESNLFLNYLFMERNGICALRAGLITPEQFSVMPTFNLAALLNVKNGILALREGLITPEQAANMPNLEHLHHLLSDNGILALRERLITSEQAAIMQHNDIEREISDRLESREQEVIETHGCALM